MRTSGTVKVDPKELRLRWLFLDLNSFFASVEQAEDPSLRNKPVAVAPTSGDGGTCIAASYEAKAYGVKTGTKVGEAKRLCPDLQVVSPEHVKYVKYHDKILELCESVSPVDRVCSIDEMRFRLLGSECTREGSTKVARDLKAAIQDGLSPCLTSSIGVATNSYLAKIGTELEKPDGLVVIEASELPGRLHSLSLRDFTGINRKFEARMMAVGIFTSADFLAAPVQQLQKVFGKVVGERWWYLLRGYDIDVEAGHHRSLSHSHVLAPELRNDPGVRAILKRLTYKACMRLRSVGLWAEHVSFAVKGVEVWTFDTNIPATQDALTVLGRLERVWSGIEFQRPIQAGVCFTKLRETSAVTPSLFEDTLSGSRVGHALDALNHKFGKNTVYVASTTRTKDHAGEKIAFHKTRLLSEGKGDNL